MAAISSQVATADFLNLLTIQLQNQDPIDPVKQEDFISQLSQFSTLEGVEALNASFDEMLEIQQLNQGIDLIGKNAEYTNAETGEKESGQVEQLFTDQGPLDVLINGQRISLSLVSGIKA